MKSEENEGWSIETFVTKAEQMKVTDKHVKNITDKILEEVSIESVVTQEFLNRTYRI